MSEFPFGFHGCLKLPWLINVQCWLVVELAQYYVKMGIFSHLGRGEFFLKIFEVPPPVSQVGGLVLCGFVELSWKPLTLLALRRILRYLAQFN